MEIWKDIEGFDGLYQVSNHGNVRSLDRICGKMPNGSARHVTGKMMTPADNGHGYLVIQLKREGKRWPRYVHRLVAEAFVEKPDGCSVVNHIDYDTKNNAATNLEWCTQKENMQHSRPRLCVTHNTPSSTGEKYISFRKDCGRYRVNIKKVRVDKQFKTIEEAVAFRNEVLNEFSISK